MKKFSIGSCLLILENVMMVCWGNIRHFVFEITSTFKLPEGW